jgi:hypothetical protein
VVGECAIPSEDPALAQEREKQQKDEQPMLVREKPVKIVKQETQETRNEETIVCEERAFEECVHEDQVEKKEKEGETVVPSEEDKRDSAVTDEEPKVTAGAASCPVTLVAAGEEVVEETKGCPVIHEITDLMERKDHLRPKRLRVRRRPSW